MNNLISIRLEEARKAVARSETIPEAKKAADIAAALNIYAKSQEAGAEIINDTAELQLWAARRLGELLLKTDKLNGSRGVGKKVEFTKQTPLLKEFGVQKRQAYVTQNLASVPEARLASDISALREKGEIRFNSVVKTYLSAKRKQNRVKRINEISKGNKELSSEIRFPVIYCDPPWRYEHCETENRAIENQYPTMALEEICKLPIHKIAAPDCVCFMWATSPKLEESMRVLFSWGFSYRTCAVWVKDKIGMGYYFRQKHELLLVATLGNPPVPEASDRISSVIEAPRTRHSAKPESVYGIIEKMYPDFDKVELFCRTPRKGWHVWGNESAS